MVKPLSTYQNAMSACECGGGVEISIHSVCFSSSLLTHGYQEIFLCIFMLWALSWESKEPKPTEKSASAWMNFFVCMYVCMYTVHTAAGDNQFKSGRVLYMMVGNLLGIG